MKSKNIVSRTYVLGDLHGAHKALLDVLRKVNFNYEEDTLIFIGDLADGWGYFNECVKILLKIKNFVPILGNHDLYLMKYLNSGKINPNWLKQGGEKTLKILKESSDYDFLKLSDYFRLSKYYHIIEDKMFCHGGFNQNRLITKQKLTTFSINRRLSKLAKNYHKQGLKIKPIFDEQNSIKIKEIFVGHSPTKNLKPSFYANLINVDTGAGSMGCLTLMNVYNKQYVQSNKCTKYYKSL